MNYDSFLAEWNGKQVTAYGGECVALVAEYCHESSKPIVWGNAIDWANNPVMLGAFDWVQNDPNNFSQVPARGEIMVWSGNLPGSGGFGHVAIFDEVTAAGAFKSFDQNWGGAEAHFQTHNWIDVLGWYTLKPNAPTIPAPHPDPAPANPLPAAPVAVPEAPVPAPESVPAAPAPVPDVPAPAVPPAPEVAPAEPAPVTEADSPAPAEAQPASSTVVTAQPQNFLRRLILAILAFLKKLNTIG